MVTFAAADAADPPNQLIRLDDILMPWKEGEEYLMKYCMFSYEEMKEYIDKLPYEYL